MGWYVDQIVCRVDERGRNVATYFREEISEPFGEQSRADMKTPFEMLHWKYEFVNVD